MTYKPFSSKHWNHVGKHHTEIAPESTFDPSHPQVKEDIIRMIVQYLQYEGYSMSSTTIQDEANVKLQKMQQRRIQIKRMGKCITDGDWDMVNTLATKYLRRQNQKGFLYAVTKQEYLELIDRQEYQKAFTYLTTHLKPMENLSRASGKNEFHDLCYLLTSKSVNEAESFREWEGILAEREKLTEQFKVTLEYEISASPDHVHVPENRLLSLLHQAVAYQMEFSRYHPRIVPQVSTLLNDFECVVLPNAVKTTFVGHTANIKCVKFVNQEGSILASGSSDNTIKLWAVEPSKSDDLDGREEELREASFRSDYAEEIREPLSTLEGHSSRIWDLVSDRNGQQLYTASGDGTVKVWNISSTTSPQVCAATITGHIGDVYSVNIHPGENHIVTGGYDKSVRLFDVRTGMLTKTFTGHTASISQAIFSPHGNLIISGSKDNTIRFWDIISGLCVRTLRQTLGEITSVEMNRTGLLLLSGSKNNSNRLWDIRMTGSASSSREDKPIQRFKGHQNTAKNFVRASFGPKESFVFGGSEDGYVYVWDVDSGQLLERLYGHKSVVYSVAWHERQSLMASCSHDNTVKTWWFDEQLVS